MGLFSNIYLKPNGEKLLISIICAKHKKLN